MIPEINSLIQKLTELRTEFENGISNGKSYAEVKVIYQQMKELGMLLKKQYEASGGKEAAAN
jgi:hypothetical protein